MYLKRKSYLRYSYCKITCPVNIYICTYPWLNFTYVKKLKFLNIPVHTYAKQKHLGRKKERGQSEATLQTGRCDQKV